MNEFNPYRQNCGIIKSFSKKPIILITAISVTLLTVSEILSAIITGTFSIIPILNIIATIALYALIAVKKKADVPPKAFVKSANIYFILMIIISALNISTRLLLTFESEYMNSALTIIPIASNFAFTSLNEMLIYLLYYTAGILFALSGLILTSSIKKSTSTIYLKTNGSIFFTVMSLINATQTATVLGFKLYLLLSAPLYLFSDGFIITAANPALEISRLAVYAEDIFVCVLLIVVYVLLAIDAIKYHIYVSKIINGRSSDFFETEANKETLNSEQTQVAEDNDVLNLWRKSYMMPRSKSNKGNNPNVAFPKKSENPYDKS